MPLSPSELREHSLASIHIDAICADIDERLKALATTEDLTTTVTVVVRRLPTWAIREIERRYKEVGWQYVQVARSADTFSYLNFGLPVDEQ